MEKRDITVTSVVDGKTFREFARFDVMRRQRRWLRPALFALVFTGFSLIAFSQSGRKEHAALLGGVLLAVGLALPAAYFLSFFLSVRRQSRQFDGKTAAYRLTLGESGLTVTKGGDTLSCPWERLCAVHRLKSCICLYVDRQHAFLLPKSCGEKLYAKAWQRILEKTRATPNVKRPLL